MLSIRQRASILDLYAEEIHSRIAKLSPPQVDFHFGDLLRFDSLCRNFTQDELGEVKSLQLWRELISSPLNDQLYEVVLRFLSLGM